MPAAARNPLNYDAPDIRGVLESEPVDLRVEIDYWRSEVHRTRARLDEAIRLAGLNFHTPNTRVDTPERAGGRYRRARAALQLLLQLDRLQRGEPAHQHPSE